MKRIFYMLICLSLIFMSTVSVSAADGSVLYDGNANEFIFATGSKYSPTDLFSDFKDVMPGDILTQKITVKNDVSNNVKIKVYMRSLGAHADSVDFLSQLGLRVKKSDGNLMGYMFDSTADETAQLTDWVCLGVLYSGGEVDLDVILEVPKELNNTYKDEIGYLDWEFKVEELPVESGDPTPPATSDNFNIMLWLSVFSISGIAIILLIILKRKKSQ